MKYLPHAALLALCALEAACSPGGAIPNSPSPATQAAQSQSAARDLVATVPPWRQLGASDRGPAPATSSLTIAVTLRYRDQAKLDALVAQQANPLSPSYRRWLSNDAFDRQFAPSEASYARVIDSLRGAGFHIDATYANRTVLDASAPVAAIERFFQTSIHRVAMPKQGLAYVNVRPAVAPAQLAGLVLSVDGLDTIAVMHAGYALHRRGTHASGVRPHESSSLFGPVSTVTAARGYAPLAYAAGYNFPIVNSSGGAAYDGSGRASGIIIDADFAESDLRQYLGYFGITRTGPATNRVLIHGGPPQGDAAGDSIEASLDAETIVGLAPGTALSMYEIPSLENKYVADAFNTVVDDNAVDTVNESFGGCEVYIGGRTVMALNAIAEQGAAKGITFHAATGDNGGLLCANAPAASPYVVAVGGTTLTVGSGGAWAAEAGWSGSGGGISSLFAQPSWQAGVSGTINRGRNIPDVAFNADPNTGSAYFYTGTWNTQYNPLGGTSLSSPIYGALVTEIDQVKGGRIGLGTAGLYGFFATNGYANGSTTYFHDIVLGNNSAYYAVPGYDLVTGIGSVDAWNVAGQL
jgi:subtilase family serine protease